jgi:hypothetical protein
VSVCATTALHAVIVFFSTSSAVVIFAPRQDTVPRTCRNELPPPGQEYSAS